MQIHFQDLFKSRFLVRLFCPIKVILKFILFFFLFLQGEVQCASVSSNVLATNNSYCNIMVSIVMGSNSLATSALTH